MVTYGAPVDPEYLQVRHFLQQLDRSKFGKFLADLHNLVTSGAKQSGPSYPRTLSAANNLVKERVEHNTVPAQNPVVYFTSVALKRTRRPRKFRKRAEQPKHAPPVTGTCDLCGNAGHYIRSCPRLEAAKEAITGDENRFTAATFGFEGSRTVYMAHGGQACDLTDTDILLDTQANVSIFKNKSLLQDVQQVDTEIEMSGFVKG